MYFFFSSRRRHTRFDCDWSSDVCSSDLRWEGRRSSQQPIHNQEVKKEPSARSSTDRHAASSSGRDGGRSEEHTSELQSQSNLVCRLLLEKKKHTRTSKLSDHKSRTIRHA